MIMSFRKFRYVRQVRCTCYRQLLPSPRISPSLEKKKSFISIKNKILYSMHVYNYCIVLRMCSNSQINELYIIANKSLCSNSIHHRKCATISIHFPLPYMLKKKKCVDHLSVCSWVTGLGVLMDSACQW